MIGGKLLMSLIVIEGLDGAGSSTQVNLLIEYLKSIGKKVDFMHFPNYEEKYTGELISKYLRGEFANINQNIIYYLYAINRYLCLTDLEQKLENNDYVILDRYVISSMAYQGINIKNIVEEDFKNNKLIKEKISYIYKLMTDLEFQVFGLPIPTYEIYLQVPFHHIEKVNKQRTTDNSRKYLKGKNDIHETNFQYLKLVDKMYNYIFDNFDDRRYKVKCFDNQFEMLDPKEIHKLIVDIII